MGKETTGTVVSVAKEWRFKVNTKPVRMGTPDGAGQAVPAVGSEVTVLYRSNKPGKAKIL